MTPILSDISRRSIQGLTGSESQLDDDVRNRRDGGLVVENRTRLRSLAMRTEVAVSMHGSELRRHDGYWTVRSPDNLDYWMGNCLIFDTAPGHDDFERFMDLFEREHDVEHRVFRLDTSDGHAGHSRPFLDAGFEVEHMHVLSATDVRPPSKQNPRIAVRPIESPEEWEQVLALRLLVGTQDDGHTPSSGFTAFKRARVAYHRRMQDSGLGHIWGAFAGCRLVGCLGLFHVEELSRFQEVATHPDARRQGVCGSLVHAVCERALAARPGRRLVMCAVEDYHATKIYQSLGFRVVERSVDFKRPPPQP